MCNLLSFFLHKTHYNKILLQCYIWLHLQLVWNSSRWDLSAFLCVKINSLNPKPHLSNCSLFFFTPNCHSLSYALIFMLNISGYNIAIENIDTSQTIGLFMLWYLLVYITLLYVVTLTLVKKNNTRNDNKQLTKVYLCSVSASQKISLMFYGLFNVSYLRPLKPQT